MGAGACREKKTYKWVGDGQRGGGRGHRTGGLGGCSSPWLRPIHRRPQPLSPPKQPSSPPHHHLPFEAGRVRCQKQLSFWQHGGDGACLRAVSTSSLSAAACRCRAFSFASCFASPGARIFAPEQASGRHCPETIVNQPSSRPKQRRRGCGRASCAGGTLPSARCRLWAYS